MKSNLLSVKHTFEPLMPIMFIDEHIVCIKSRQHVAKARSGQFVQKGTAGPRGGRDLTFLAFPWWACRGCESETLHFHKTATQAMRQPGKRGL